MKILVFAISLFLCLSCSPEATSNSQNVDYKTEGRNNKNQVQRMGLGQNDSLSSVVYDDEFIIRVLEGDFTLSNLKKIYKPKEVHHKLVQNKHYLGKKDTLLIFIVEKDSIGFYKGVENALPQKVVITSEKMTIDKDIKIGVNRSLFQAKFKNKVMFDSLVVRDTEGGNFVAFFFRKDSLVRILYQAEYTD